MHLRKATATDQELLTLLLVEAVNWREQTRLTRGQIMAEPRNSQYVTEWQRPTDFGTVAVSDSDSDSNEPMGAVWAGVSSRDQPGYGFISESVPELSIAVFPGRRGEGIGGVLLRACIERSRALGWSALSLNVEDGNHTALSLYQRHSFRVVGRNGESDTMLLDL